MSNFSSLYGNVCNYSFSNRYSPSLWSRFQPADYNTATFTPEQINERRKCEILKYKSNTTQSTKKQRFAAASKGLLLKKRGFASQTDTLTVSNTANLPEVNGVFICPSSEKKCTLTTESDVPGPPRLLCLDDNVPLYNHVRAYEYKSGQVLKSRIPTTALTSPNNVTIVSGNKSLIVSWLPPDSDSKGLYGGYDLAGYLLEYSTDRTNWTCISSTVSTVSDSPGYVTATTLTYTINSLVNNTLYYVKIYSVNKSTPKATPGSTSTFPAIASATTFLIPSKPLNFTVTGDTAATVVTTTRQGGSFNIDKTNLIAAWTAPSFNGGTPILSYRIQYSVDKVSWTTLEVRVGSTDLAFNSDNGTYTYRFTGPNDQGLNVLSILTKSTYYVRISAVNEVVRDDGYASPFSTTLPVNTLNVPSSVTGVTISSGTQAGVVLLAWNPPADNGGSDIQAYSVSYYKTVDTLKSIVFTGSTTLTKFTVSGLDSENQYYTFLISALNGTYASTPYEITGRANTMPGKPIGFKVAAVNGQFVVSFVIDDSGGSAITSYIIGVSKNNNTWDNYEYSPVNTQSAGAVQLNLSTSVMTVGSTRPVFETKIPYYFRVSSRNALFPLKEGAFTTTDTIGTIVVVPNPITDISIQELTRPVVTISPVTGLFVETVESYLLLKWWWTSSKGGTPTTVVSDDIGGDKIENIGYILEYSETIGNFKIWTRFNTTANLIKERTLAFTYIKPETNYFFRVYAVNTIGTSTASVIYNTRTNSALLE
jgi:hypothetical protein